MSDALEKGMDFSRRQFMGKLALGSGALLLPSHVKASESRDFWSRPRKLSLLRPATGESWSGCYWRDGGPDNEGYSRVCALMRDIHENEVAPIHPRLLDLLCAIQSWVRPYGYTSPIHINSGYRTVKTNTHLEGAARQSMHLKGRAADIVLPGLPTVYLGHLAARYAGGGVGFYIDKGFVHLDTGKIRYWSR